jgi:hypothetical protein
LRRRGTTKGRYSRRPWCSPGPRLAPCDDRSRCIRSRLESASVSHASAVLGPTKPTRRLPVHIHGFTLAP